MAKLSMDQQRETEACTCCKSPASEAREAELVNTLSGGLAHHLNNELQVLYATSSSLARAALTPSMIVNTQALLASAQRLADLSSRIGVASAGEGVALCDLSTCLCDWSEAIANLCTRDIALEIAPHAAPVQVYTSVERLRDAMLQLVANAVEAVGESARKRIAVRSGTCMLQGDVRRHARPYTHVRPEPYGYIEIEDSGIGIQSEHLPRIFDPFFSTHQMGRGLGLSQVLTFVKTCRGLISVYPLKARGACARMMFPLSGGDDVAGPGSDNSGVYASV